MKIFIDTANIQQIKEVAALGVLDGVTTNPSLIAKEGKPYDELLRQICKIVDGPVSAEVTATDYEDMLAQGKKLVNIHPNIVVKLPTIREGLKACAKLSSEGIRVNMTLCFSPAQALLAAKAGAFYISPFVGRLDDISHLGMDLVRDIMQIYGNYDYPTEVLVASIRHPLHVYDAAMAGADAATMPFSVIEQLLKHPLTDLGLDRFLADWGKSGQSI